MKINCAIFDMDGTLVDSLAFWDSFWNDFGFVYMHEDNFVPDDDVNKHIRTMIYTESIKYIREYYKLSASEDELMEFATKELADFYTNVAKTRKGAVELLEWFKAQGIKMCVASATDLKYVKIAIDSCGLAKYFDAVLSCSDIGRGKEHPDIFLKAAEMIGGNVSDTCVFEDSCVALETAKQAGFKTVGIYDKHNFGHDRSRAAADIYVDDGISLAWLNDRISK